VGFIVTIKKYLRSQTLLLKVGKKILKILGYIIGGILLLLLVIALLIQTPPVQNFLKDKALTFFKEKVNTEADIGRINLSWPDDLVVDDLYVEDQQGDTLAYVKKLRVATNMWWLLKGELDISVIELNGFVGYMSRNEADSAFNFDFIVEAFTTDSIPADTTVNKSPSTFDIMVNGILIENSRFYYKDPISGFDMWYSIGKFDAEISDFDINQTIIHVSEVNLSDSYGEFIQTKNVPPSNDPTEPFAFDLDVEDVSIERVKFFFETIPGELKLLSDVGSLTGTLDEIDVLNMNYSAKELHLANSNVEIDILGAGSTDTLQQNSTSALDTLVLNVFSQTITFENTNFRFDDHTEPEAPGFDPLHFAFTNINGEFKEPRYRLEGFDSYAYGTVESLTAEEEAGMALTKLNGVVEFTPTHTLAKDFTIAAGQSNISGEFRISYSSLEAMAENPGEINLSIDLAPSTVNINDVVYFVPDMNEQIKTLPEDARSVNMEGELEGKISALNIEYFHLKGLKNTTIDVEGYLAGMPDMNSFYADFTLAKLQTTRVDMQAVLPDTLIPPTITLPQTMAVEGGVKGDMQKATGKLAITTSMGNGKIDASIQMGKDSVYEYTGALEVNDFNVGKLIQQEEMMGNVTLNIIAEGEGFTLEDLNTELEGKVNKFTYNNYTYNDLVINGMLFKKEFSGNLAMEDKNLNFDFEGTVDLNDSIPKFMFYLELDNADLQALNFVQDEFQIQGNLDSDLKAGDLENITGLMEIKDLVINKGGEKYTVDSLELRSIKEGNETNLTIHSDFMTATFNGQFEVVNLPEVIKAHINQYYELMDDASTEGISPQSFTFNINIFDTELIEALVPDLKTLEVEEFSGTYNSEEWFMEILINIPEIDYAGMKIDTLKVQLTSDEEEMNYDVRVASLQSGLLPVKNIWLEGIVAANHINTALHIQNEAGEDKYLYGGIFTTWEEQYYQLQLTPGRVIMDYEEWTVYPGNSIQFYPSGMIIEDLRLSHEEQQLAVESNINAEQDTLINLTFNNFNIETLTKIAQQDTITILSGILNGSADLNTSAETFAFTSDLSIQSLAYKRDTVGNFSLNAYSSGGDRYNLTASLDGRDNQMTVEGYYEADSAAGILHFDANLESLTFKTVEAFSMGELSESRGYLNGNLAIRGTVKDPDITGSIGFEDVSTKVSYLQAWMLINNEKINFDRRGIHLNSFTINDGSGNDFTVNGNILTTDYSFFRFNLNATMRNFLMLNTGAGDNPLFYGTLIADSDISVRGDSELPVINMDVSLNNDSRITYIVPEAELVTIEREGLIEFMDRSVIEQQWEQDTVVVEDDEVDESAESRFKGISFTANIDVDPSNSITVVIDPATGDRLSNLRGEANLALNINPTGDITLNGRYTVEEGTYMMRLFGLARREFSIVGGSSLIWTGDPLNARLDINAQYEVLASPQPLYNNVQRVAGGVNQYAKQPILVNLALEGTLLSPEISFTLSMPEDEQRGNIMALLQEINSQESRVLEEVLSLVVFRRFSGGNILSGGGAGPEATARQSVSRVLSQQLNQLGGQIKGVDISFDVQSYEDYSQTGDPYNRTEVELGLSTRFFNDRVIVKVAGNFDVEGESQRQQSSLADFAGDIVVEYLITQDGRFRLMGFRKNEYEDLLQGEIMETGIGLIFVKDYDSLSELFKGLNNKGE
jgi:translocation and assembly module TamB